MYFSCIENGRNKVFKIFQLKFFIVLLKFDIRKHSYKKGVE